MGLEIIKRLINHQLLEQHEDKLDKRGKHFKLTPLGQSEFYKAFEGMHKICKIISEKLSDVE